MKWRIKECKRKENAVLPNIRHTCSIWASYSDISYLSRMSVELTYFVERTKTSFVYLYRHRRHLLNFVGLSIADSHVTFLSDKYTKLKDFAYVPYHDTSLPLREQLCLRFAERICPMGVEALLLQALTRSSVREDLIKEARLGNVIWARFIIYFKVPWFESVSNCSVGVPGFMARVCNTSSE